MKYELNATRDLSYLTDEVMHSSVTWCSLLQYTESEIQAATEENCSNFAVFNINRQLAQCSIQNAAHSSHCFQQVNT